MRKHYKHLCLFIFSILINWNSYASNGMSFHLLGVESGMSDNYIQDILHDQYGFMWFATRNGLNRYDGYHFRQYTTIPLGAYDNNIEWVAEDASGTIWLKNPVNYCFYNRETDELENKIEKPLGKLGIQGVAKQLYIDEDHNLWCIVNHSLYHYQFKKNKLSHFSLPDSAQIMDLTCRQSNAYLLLSDGNIATINWSSNTIQHETQIKLYSEFQSHIYIDSTYNLWLYATHGSHIECYSPKEKEWVSFAGQKELNNGHNIITTVTDDGKGNIWIGTDNKGIFICHSYNNKFTQINKEGDKLFSLPSNHITSIFKDEQDIMWIGTGKKGVAYSSLHDIIIENYRCPQQEDVSCLLEDKNGDLWLGFDGEGIAKYNKTLDKYTYFKLKENSIPSNLTVCSYLDSKERIWFGSFGGGAYFHKDGKFTSLTSITKTQHIEQPHYIRRITEDAKGNLWFATYTQGLYCLNNDGSFSSYTMNNSLLLTNYIADLSCVDGRLLYIATSSGVYRVDTFTRELTQLTQDKSGTEIIQDNFANCLYQDSRGLLWIGGRKGINIYNPITNAITHLTTNQGLSHPYIRAIVEDYNKNMWVTTDHGLTHINIVNDPDAKKIKFRCYPYFEEDGIANNLTFNNFAIICDKQNDILAGGSGGYVKIHTPSFIPRQNEHRIIYTELYLANQQVAPGIPTSDGRILLDKNIQLLTEISMDYFDNNFALEVSAMDYTNRHKLQYVYRLGEKDQWIKLEGNRIYFNKLSPGIHYLQVKVDEKNYNADNQSSTLIIRVRPPFWLSTFAYITYAIVSILLMFLFAMKMRRKHLHILQRQKREMEIAQQHEMDESKMRFFTNVSHDLRTPLSLIITPLEKILSSNSIQNIQEDLHLIHRNAITLLDEVNQLLDFRKLDQGKVQFSPSYGNLSEFIREGCASLQSLLFQNNIQIDLKVYSSSIDMNFDRNKMQRILLNLLSNAIKYNHRNGKVTVTVEKVLTSEGDQARIQVADTGIGIKDENKEKIFDRFYQEQRYTALYEGSGIGLHIVKEYVTLHNGHIEAKDNHPQGTIFVLTFPIMETFCEEITNPIEPNLHEAKDANDTNEEDSDHLLICNNEKKNILVVEDNDDFRQFLINCLKESYHVYDAPDGKKAMTILTQQSVQIIISDVMMPVMDGMELCKRIKTDIRYSHIPIILLTARTAEEHILSGLKEGADDYITKPFNLDILLLRIQKLLKWTENNYEKFKTIDVSPSEITISSLDEQLIEKAIRAVEENMDNSEFSVEELSSYVGMSRGHLYKKLMLITGKSPLEFIRILRIKRGRQLLEKSQLSISQISYQIGLSPKLFAKYFKDEFGYVPSEYIKNKDISSLS